MSQEPCPENTNALLALDCAAIACGCVAVGIAIGEVFAPSFTELLPAPILFAMAFAAIGTTLREVSVRNKLAEEHACFTASHRELEDKVRWLELTEAYAKVGHWRLDLETNDVFWSDTTYAIHGLKPRTPPSLERALNFYHEDDRPIVTGSIDRARETGNFEPFNARLIDADRTLRYVESGAIVECDEAGKPIALFGVFKDRTEEENMQRELREASEDAHALARAKGMFLARMSHEIRTPMNGLLGFAELLAESELDEEQKRQADFIVQSGHSLQALLKNILDFTKNEAGKVQLNANQTDLTAFVEETMHSALPLAQSKHIRIHHEIAKDLPMFVTLDALRLKQVLTNLLSNAVRFTDQGMVSLSVSRRADRLRFAVSDTGIGISERMQERIFEPFTQESRSAVVERGGTGLGLAISRQLAQLMDGAISVRSTPGEGSTFTLELPLVTSSATSEDIASLPPVFSSGSDQRKQLLGSQSETAHPLSNAHARPERGSPLANERQTRVLLAEDHDINRELVLQMAKRIGVELDCAKDGLEAVAMVHQARAIGRPYALVLMDLQMPTLDGLGATLRLRQSGILAEDLPIIAVTANAFADDITNCMNAGMQAHLPKPLSFEALSSAIERWVPGGVPNDQASAA